MAIGSNDRIASDGDGWPCLLVKGSGKSHFNLVQKHDVDGDTACTSSAGNGGLARGVQGNGHVLSGKHKLDGLAKEQPANSWLALGISLVTIIAYSLNSYVFSCIGQAAFTSKLFHLWLCHVGSLLLAPLLLNHGTDGIRATIAEYRPNSSNPGLSLVKNTTLLALFSMVVYYFWFLAASKLPGQILAAIFQSSIAVMYILSVLVLGERFSWLKASGVALAMLGVFVSSIFPARRPNGVDQENALFDEAASTGDFTLGVLFAVLATLSQAVYKVWFKYTFGNASANFTFLLTLLGGVAHVFPILPILGLGHVLGFPDSQIFLRIESVSDAGLLFLAVLISACVNVGSRTVIAIKSPVYWAAAQMLGIPLSVAFDFFMSDVSASLGGIIGYLLIAAGFLLLSDIVDFTFVLDRRRKQAESKIA